MRNLNSIICTACAIGAVVCISAAAAADLPARTYTKAPAMVAAAPISWTGCYVGVEAGYGWGRETVTSTEVGAVGTPVTSINPRGGLGGGTVGCNWQSSSL